MKSIMDESGWWSPAIPATKRASHVLFIGFVCVSLAAGLTHGAEFGSRREHADHRQTHHHHHHHHHARETLHTTFTQHRDAISNSDILNNLLALKQNSHNADFDSLRAGKLGSSHSNTDVHSSDNVIKTAVDSSSRSSSSSSSSISLLTASMVSRLNSSAAAASSSSAPAPGSNRRRGDERLPGQHSRGASNTSLAPHHHLRPASHLDAGAAGRRVKRVASNRGNSFIYEHGILAPKQLFCRTQYRLAIYSDGTINGTRNNLDPYSILYIQSHRMSYVSFKGKESKLYVCVDDSGNLTGMPTVSRNCFFQESLEPSFYNSYAFRSFGSSSKRRKKRTYFLSINKNGSARIVKVRSQKKAQLLPVPPSKPESSRGLG